MYNILSIFLLSFLLKEAAKIHSGFRCDRKQYVNTISTYFRPVHGESRASCVRRKEERLEERNKERERDAGGRADQSRIKRLLKNTSTCAQTFPCCCCCCCSSSSSLPLSTFMLSLLRAIAALSELWVVFPRAEACPLM